MKTSVALCTYNGGQYLALQLMSILQQTLPLDEIIICDDGSQDNTFNIIESFMQLYPGKIQLHVNEKNVGAKFNFEKAINLCTGDFIFLSDQDDEWLPDKVAKTLRFFEKHPLASGVFSDGKLIDNTGAELAYTMWQSIGFSEAIRAEMDPSKLFDLLIRINNIVTGAALCIKKEARHFIFPFFCPEHYWHDYWISLSLAFCSQLYFINEPLLRYRLHSNQQASLPKVDSHYDQQHHIKEKVWAAHYDRVNIERFIYYNVGGRKRLQLFGEHLVRIHRNAQRVDSLNHFLFSELEALKRIFFRKIRFRGRKKIAILSITGRQKTLNITKADIFRLLFT